MSASIDNESEILLGNKQLLAVFAVVAVLLAVAFTGGYMVGKNSGDKKPSAANTEGGAGDSGALVTRTVPPAATPDASESKASDSKAGDSKDSVRDEGQFVAVPVPDSSKSDERSSAKVKAPPAKADSPSPVSEAGFAPEAGQTFLQVAAVGKDEADAVADVLHKKGYRAHSVPKPGNAKIYRVLVGPLKDAGDLAATRDSLRKTAGFREVIVQHY